jgi:hypothetical protein
MDNIPPTTEPPPPPASTPTPASSPGTFLVRHICPYPVVAPEITDTTCPICLTPYGEQRQDIDADPTAEAESPVLANLPDCRHSFGDRCLEIVVYLGGEGHRNECPLYRTVWFTLEDDVPLWSEA